jgi:hypothetical protein
MVTMIEGVSFYGAFTALSAARANLWVGLVNPPEKLEEPWRVIYA